MLGKQYLIDAIVDAHKAEQEEKAYKIYVTDTLKLIVEAYYQAHGGNAELNRYADIVNKKPADTRTADEIISSLVSRLNEDDDDDTGGEEP